MKNSEFNLITISNSPDRNIDLKGFSARDSVTLMAMRILSEIMLFRRVSNARDLCMNVDCLMCSSLHLPKIISAVKAQVPVSFVLPAFPGKSPNMNKVLGTLPDFAEELALKFLGHLCVCIKKIYPFGIKIILCSDGRVFSDLIGIKEHDVTAYQDELGRLIEKMSLSDILILNLDDFYGELNFEKMRDELMKSYGRPLEALQLLVRNGVNPSASQDELEANRMYRGITRFLFEDNVYPGQIKTRSAIQRESRTKAYEVMRRSNAWSELIAEYFPDAVRLSIHPQICGSKKIGIRLIGNEGWMTPWHGVAMETKSGPVLVKRSEAEALGAKLIYSSNGLPSHYKLLTDQILTVKGV